MIRIMVDSASDCGVQDFDMFIPMSISMNGKEYRSGLDLDSDTFYRLLTSSGEFPQTSQPSPNDFLECFLKIKEAGDELLYFCISSALSGTYQSANIAKAMAEYDGIHLIDTKTASHMIALLASSAQKWIEEGCFAREVVEKCEELQGRIRVFAGVDTLEYLKRGGRIGKAAALVGTLANIKPMITVSEEGVVAPLGKALGFGRAVQTLVEKVKGFEIDRSYPICSLYTYGEENCIRLEEKLKAEGIKVDARKQVGPTIGTHVGSGIYGIFFVEKP